MKRKQRGFISQTLVAYVVLILLASCRKSPEIVAGAMDAGAGNPAGPNVLFISMDDLND